MKVKRIVIVLIIFFTSLFIMGNKSFASFNIEGAVGKYSLPDLPKGDNRFNQAYYFIMYDKTINRYDLVCFSDYPEDFKFSVDSSNNYIHYNASKCYIWYVEGEAKAWKFNEWQIDQNAYELCFKFYKDSIVNHFIYTSFDIKNMANDLVFQKPVPQEVLTLELGKTEIMRTYQTMMRGIIKYLLLFLILLVGFWKAWHILLSLLHKG